MANGALQVVLEMVILFLYKIVNNIAGFLLKGDGRFQLHAISFQCRNA